MRIALIDPSLFTLPYDSALAGGLAAAGHEVALYGRALSEADGLPGGVTLSPHFYRVANGRLVAALPDRLRLFAKGVDHAWSMASLLTQLRRQRPDAIHFQWLPLPLVDQLLLSRFKAIAPLVLTVHDTNPFNGDPSASIQSRGFGRCLQIFDRLIVHTAQGEARLRKLGLPPSRIAVRPHGLLCDVAAAEADPMTAAPLTFLLFGKIKPYKGADLLIEAFAALPDAVRAQARLRIVGKPYMDLTALRAAAAPFGNAVAFETGFVDDADIPALFGPGTVAVFPYREIEASGVMFLAMAHGRPIIASQLGSFAETLQNGLTGRLLPPGNVSALAAAMADMVTDRPFAATCADAVRDLAVATPCWQDIAESTGAALCLSDARPPGDTGECRGQPGPGVTVVSQAVPRPLVELCRQTVPEPGWFVPSCLASCLFLQRFGVPFGDLSINIVGPIGLCLAAAAIATRRLELHRGRLCMFACLLGFIMLGSTVNGGRPDPFVGANIPSTLQFVGITSFAVLSFARPMDELTFFRLVNKLLLIVAVAGILQFLAQFVGLAVFSFTPYLPQAVLATSNWNLEIPLGIGSLMKSNGFFLVEPSVMSQLMSIGLMIEVLALRRLPYIAILGGGFLLSFSGTGGILLFVFMLVVAVRLGWRGVMVAVGLLLLIGLVIGLVTVLAPDVAASLTSRLNEINTPGTSGHMRFITPFWLLSDVLDRTPQAAIFGLGGGVSERLVIPYNYDVNTPVKVGLEYGFPALVCYIMVFLVGRRSALQSVLVPPGMVLLTLTGGYQQFAPVVYFVALICGAKLDSSHPATSARTSRLTLGLGHDMATGQRHIDRVVL